MDIRHSKILVMGGRGMVGSALLRALRQKGCESLLAPPREELDCTEQASVRAYLQSHRPDVVIIAAAQVGGIVANSTFPADFLYQNVMIASNLIHESHRADIQRVLFLGSTCIYPRDAVQPIREEALLTGPLEKTNEGYALAKICGVQLCAHYTRQYGRDYIAAMPTNLYGPGDRYHPEYSHVIPGLIRRIHEAKCTDASNVTVWGSGEVWREFLYVEDLAEACLFLLNTYRDPMHINVGSAEEVTIAALARLIAHTVGYQGEIVQDRSKPDGTPRKKSDCSRLQRLGWEAKTSLEEGLCYTYADFLKSMNLSQYSKLS